MDMQVLDITKESLSDLMVQIIADWHSFLWMDILPTGNIIWVHALSEWQEY